jgi:hypothetical protein
VTNGTAYDPVLLASIFNDYIAEFIALAGIDDIILEITFKVKSSSKRAGLIGQDGASTQIVVLSASATVVFDVTLDEIGIINDSYSAAVTDSEGIKSVFETLNAIDLGNTVSQGTQVDKPTLSPAVATPSLSPSPSAVPSFVPSLMVSSAPSRPQIL